MKLNNFGASLLTGLSLIASFATQSASAQQTAINGSKPKYIVIQNIATEKTRVYELCYQYDGCPHKLVFESDMLVGKRNKDEAHTILGVFTIDAWTKFYQDGNGTYPSWYDSNYPMPPKPGSGGRAWFKSKYMPGGKGEMRGAFGWYTATVSPNASGQWMHGTIGWGSDGDAFLARAKGGFLSIFVDLRSHGCTRHENRAIAYLQSLVPAGTPLVKIYAEERMDDPSLARYEDQKAQYMFNYALTKDQVRSKKPDSIEYSVVMNKINKGIISKNDILEQGT